jgi:cell division transport system permease protein
MRTSFIAREVGGGLRRNFTMTVALVVSVAVSLTLFGAALLMRSQVDRMKGYWYEKVQVSIFLCGENSLAYTCTGAVTDEQRNDVRATLEALKPTVQEIYYESSDEAYARFKEQFKGSPIIANVAPSAMPESFRVKLDDPSHYDQVANALMGKPGVESVQDQRKLLERFFQILHGLQTFALAIAGAMLFVTVLLVMNTVRVAAFARRRETSIMRSVGASNASIRLPFVLEAVTAAVLGASLAAGTMIAVKSFVIDARLQPNITFIAWVTWEDVIAILPWLFGVGIATAVLASGITLRRYLKG